MLSSSAGFGKGLIPRLFTMHICFVATGDIEKLATSKRATGLAEPLLRRGHRVTLVLEEAVANRRRVALECPNAEVIYVPPGTRLDDVKSRWAALRASNPDVVWVCNWGIRNIVLRKLAGIRGLVLVEHSEMLSYAVGSFFLRRGWETSFEWGSLFVADGLICASRYLEVLYRHRAKVLRKPLPIHYSPYAYNPEILALRGRADPVRLRDLRRVPALIY